jgi:DNA polymerase (family 10)
MHRAAGLLQYAKETLERTQPELKRVTVASDFRRGLARGRSRPGSRSAGSEKQAGGTGCGAELKSTSPTASTSAQLSCVRLDPRNISMGFVRLRKSRECGSSPTKGRSLVGAKEEDIYRALGLPFLEPELGGGRRDRAR